MKQVTIREFQRNLYGNLKKAPLVITQKRVQTFVVVPVDEWIALVGDEELKSAATEIGTG